MRQALMCVVAIVVMSMFVSQPVAAQETAFEIDITVSPNVINIASQSEVVTVHTNIAYGLVVGASVTLNGIEIAWWKSDDRGYFVAKFDAVAVKGVVEAGSTATLALMGMTTDNEPFYGADEVKVVEIKGK